jgi:hypothetical protein
MLKLLPQATTQTILDTTIELGGDGDAVSTNFLSQSVKPGILRDAGFYQTSFPDTLPPPETVRTLA